MIAIGSLLLVVAISLIVTRVATVILTATGMSRPAAQFQARSAFTGAAFTTSESEEITNHPVRRKVVANLMLLGNAGIVVAASSTILGFRGGGLGGQGWRLLELVLRLLALVYLSRSPAVDRRLTAAISRLLRRYTDLAIEDTDWIADRPLNELELREVGIVVLGILRNDGRYLGAPIGASVVATGDVLIVYGQQTLLAELDHRAAGPAGDTAHRAAVTRQRGLERSENADDRP